MAIIMAFRAIIYGFYGYYYGFRATILHTFGVQVNP